ncbi:MAG: carbonic anhydrase, partial [Bdellovibrionia bacterium]
MGIRLSVYPILLGVSVSVLSIQVWARQETKVDLPYDDSMTHIVKSEEPSNKSPARSESAANSLSINDKLLVADSASTVVSSPAPEVSPAGSVTNPTVVSAPSSVTNPPVVPPWNPGAGGSTVISPWAPVAPPIEVAPLDSAVVAQPVKEGPIKKVPLVDILKDLQEGNRRFVEGVTKSAGKDSVRRKDVLEKENPSAVVLSCSDSRVPPELIFDRGLGEIYTIRVAGNVLGAASVASIEYAIARLGVRLIVILGHESCEIVKAALKLSTGKSSGSPDLDTLVSSIYLEEKKGRTL